MDSLMTLTFHSIIPLPSLIRNSLPCFFIPLTFPLCFSQSTLYILQLKPSPPLDFLLSFFSHRGKLMAPKKNGVKKLSVMNRGAWTAEEDRKLAEYIEIHGATRWKTVSVKAGLNRCGKSCRLRWLNYLRPNIKRGNISDEEEDLILRLHKLLGNRWSLIAGRLPGRTDNEIKNYWNSHLSKKINQKLEKTEQNVPQKTWEKVQMEEEVAKGSDDNFEHSFDENHFFHFSTQGCFGLEWVNKFLELDDHEDP